MIDDLVQLAIVAANVWISRGALRHGWRTGLQPIQWGPAAAPARR